MSETLSRKDLINATLLSFKITTYDFEEIQGAAVTLYKFRPQLGVRISKIRGLKDELAAVLGVSSVRIIAPLADGSVGIEVPNRERETIYAKEIFNSWNFGNSYATLPVAIGKTVSNEVFIADLAEMPHLLVAGATGQGKSVCLNVMLMSLLHKKSPDEMKLILIDPKQVEFGLYSRIESSYLAHPVITEAEEAEGILENLCVLMDERYNLISSACVRNIKEYNELSGVKKLPYIVTVIDEYGDLIMTSGKAMERAICRIAQKARAVGIHLIISTQRPDTKIVTGNIKANFPTRIAFRTTTGVDSRVVLDQAGAEKLSGKGDMIFFSSNGTTRMQCAYASIENVMSLCDDICEKYAGYNNIPIFKNIEDNSFFYKPLLPDIEDVALKVITYPQANEASIRYMAKSDYAYTRLLIEQLEELGIIESNGYNNYNVILYRNSQKVIEIINQRREDKHVCPNEVDEQIIKQEFKRRGAEQKFQEWLREMEQRKDEIEAQRRQLYRHFYGSNTNYMTLYIPHESKIRKK